MADKPKDDEPGTSWLDIGRVTLHIVILVASIGGIAVIVWWACSSAAIDLISTMSTHAPAILGVPIAALASLGLVVLFRVADGPLRLEILGLKLEGGSASIVLWTLGFLSIIAGWRLLS